jgi:hypothetical protein
MTTVRKVTWKRGIEAHGSLIYERLQSLREVGKACNRNGRMTSSSDQKEKKKVVNSLDGFYGSVKDMVMDGTMDVKAQMLDMGWMKNG